MPDPVTLTIPSNGAFGYAETDDEEFDPETHEQQSVPVGTVDAGDVDGLEDFVDDVIDARTDLFLVSIITKTNDFDVTETEARAHIKVNKATAVVATIPKDATLNIPIGTPFEAEQYGAGTFTLAPEDGAVTLNSADGLLSTRTQFSPIFWIKTAANEWFVSGDLA